MCSRPPGTTFYRNVDARASHFWQTFDQVLVRAELVDALATVEVLRTDGTESLVTNTGRPRRTVATDHLPLYFELALGVANGY
jgi:hypothetical protein